MAKPSKELLVDGECENCGFPGIIGMTCSECGGRVIGFSESTAAKDKDDRYDDEVLGKDDNTVSLEGLAESEAADDERSKSQ